MLGKSHNKEHGTESNSPVQEQTNSEISRTETKFKDVFDHSLKTEDVKLLDITKDHIFQNKFNTWIAWRIIRIF